MIVACLAALLASSPQTESGPFQPLRPYLVGVGVASVERSARWYESNLGFETYRRIDLPERGMKIAFLKAGSFRLELVEKAGAAPLSRYLPDLKDDMLVHGLKKVAFSIDDLAAAAARLKARGVRFVVEPFDDEPMRLRSFVVADPEGNLVQLMQEVGAGDAVSELMRLESVWNEAHLRGDAEALDRLWADDLTVAVPRMTPLTRPEALAFARSGRMRFERYETSDVSIRVHGDSAVVTGRLRRSRQLGGRTVEDDWRFTKVYVREGESWRVVAFHASEHG